MEFTKQLAMDVLERRDPWAMKIKIIRTALATKIHLQILIVQND